MQVLFRAKEKNSNNYVIGYEYYNHVEDEYYITHYVSGSNYKIDRTTRSINIEDMLDRQGNKIFASLSEDGKGGDKMLRGVDMEQYGLKNTYYTAVCTRGSVLLKELSESTSISLTAYGFLKELKVIGIQE